MARAARKTPAKKGPTPEWDVSNRAVAAADRKDHGWFGNLEAEAASARKASALLDADDSASRPDRDAARAKADKAEADARAAGKSAWLTMRKMSSAKIQPAWHLVMVNDFVNVHFGALRNHPEFQFMIMAAIGTGKPSRHEWVQPPRGAAVGRLHGFFADMHPHLKDDDIDRMIRLADKGDIVDALKGAGMDAAERKEMLRGI